jgi:XRE family transcriptional regulator, aerobic/anaerobic benzoate catabolism transcriptional regulator
MSTSSHKPALLALGLDTSEPAHLPDSRYLFAIGRRVREARLRRGFSRKALAKASSVSERYLAQLESGEGNASVLLLRQIARALSVSVESLLAEGPQLTVELLEATETLRRLAPQELQRASRLLLREFSSASSADFRNRIALIGLRGAGKSTLGNRLSSRIGLPFVELDRRIEEKTGMQLGEIFDLYGQTGYRRWQRECLEELLETTPRFVLATGGSIVSDPGTFELLLGNCRTIWVRAAPEEHMKRVMAQGDMRPMANHRQAMSDLRKILNGREPLYRKADAVLDTSGATPEQSLRQILQVVWHPGIAESPAHNAKKGRR